MVLTDEGKQDIYPAATLEGTTSSGAVGVEDDYYDINTGQITDNSLISGITNTPNVYPNNNTICNPNPQGDATANSGKMYKLSSSSQKTGLGIALKVMAGDIIDIWGKSYFTETGSSTTPVPVDDILHSISGSGGVVNSGKGVTFTDLSNNTGLVSGITGLLGNQAAGTSTNPKAYINYIILDDRFNYVSGGFSRTGTAGSVKDHHSELQNINIPKNGFIYIYCSNESNLNVYFDNLQVMHTKSPILEETHYYPFGLSMAGISSKAAGGIENKYKYNKGSELQNKEFSDGSGLELYSTNFRSLDPQLGRWWQIDPKPDEAQSPYSAMNNNPILFNDPLGDTLDFPDASPEFIDQFYDAYANLDAHGVGDAVKFLIESPEHIDVYQRTGLLQGSEFTDDGVQKRLFWNPTALLQTKNGTILTAAAILDHEADHGVQSLTHPKQYDKDSDPKLGYDKQYDTKEERRAITKREQRTALALGLIKKGQVTRTEHKQGHLYNTSGPTTTDMKDVNKGMDLLRKKQNDLQKNKSSNKIIDVNVHPGSAGPCCGVRKPEQD